LSRGRAMLARELGAGDDGDNEELERWLLESRAR
jgi:hypothetical protein